jgi:hypothetical protein
MKNSGGAEGAKNEMLAEQQNKTQVEFPRFDRDTLYNYIWDVVKKELGDTIRTDELTDRICDAVTEWVPKKGDFWLEEPSGMLWVNKGWGAVTAEAPE